jgi:hypothetical protein
MPQVSTKVVNLKTIMGRPMFERGYLDAMCGAKFAKDYDDWSANQQWSYERGRLFFYGAGKVRLKQGRGVSSQAIQVYKSLRDSNVIL